jgi:hypothetical protein
VANTAVRLGFIASLLIFLTSLLLLARGSPLLVLPLSETMGLPLGNLIVWLGMLALVLIIWFGSPGLRQPSSATDRFYRGIWIVLLLLALAWPFVSYTLAGNWEFSFRRRDVFQGSGEAATWFFSFSFVVILLPIAFAVVRTLHVSVSRWVGKK